jgi:tRNA(fMet)-specific endonuclease VapC
MSGKRFLLDTNAVIALLAGNVQVVELLRDADWIGISIITYLEFLAFSGLTDTDRDLFSQFIQRINVIGLEINNVALLEQIITIRLQYRLKLPDAVIMATAMGEIAVVVSADAQLQQVTGVVVHSFTP